jgi:hypothetical protein
MRRALVLVVLAAVTALLAAAPAGARAPARVPVAVGIGDQSAAAFAHPRFAALRLKKARYFVRWNAIDDPALLARTDAYVTAARRRGIRVLMHVDGVFTRRLPSTRQYRRKVGALVRRYRAHGVREWGAWNEANSPTQPTARAPRRAAAYFLALRSLCRGCTVVALDLLDSGTVRSYARSFFRALGRRRGTVRVVGIHNYGDTNRNRSSGTRTIIRAVRAQSRRTRFWLTETGGLAHFRTAERTVFRCSLSRQRRAVRQMFALARRFRRDVDRLYPYNWYGTGCTGRFDAGLVHADGTPRPALAELRRHLRVFAR